MREPLKDEELVALFFSRDEDAIAETERKYGKLILSICRNILQNKEDAEECCNSVYLAVWQAIPPEKPQCFPAYLTRLARNAAINAGKKIARLKRLGNQSSRETEDLSDLFAEEDTAQRKCEEKELALVLDRFLSGLTNDKRRLFVLRYYHEMSTEQLARTFGVSRRAIYMRLNVLKNELRQALAREGYLP